MKKTLGIFAAIMALAIPAANAQSVLDLFGGNNSGSSNSVLGNIIEGVFTTSNITIADVAGIYEAQGPAVTFKSENLLKKAGGLAASSVIENKLDPYYKKFGLDNLKLTINNDGTFTMSAKSINLSGIIKQNKDAGTFEFQFQALGKVKLGTLTAYIEKSGNNINLMFDATKLKSFLTSLTKIVKVNMLQTVGSLLDGYDGLCMGFKMLRTGNVAGSANSNSSSNTGSALSIFGNQSSGNTNTNSTTNQSTTTPSTTTKQKSNSATTNAVQEGLNFLQNAFKKK